MSIPRTAIMAALLAGCGDDGDATKEQQDIVRQEAERACMEVFGKVASCRDDMLLLARTAPVLRGDTPELAFVAAKRFEQSMSGDLEAQCKQGIPAGLDKGADCLNDDCRQMATCMLSGFAYPAKAEGEHALQCRDRLPALEATGQAKVLQWCVMPDGTPHGLFEIRDTAGNTIAEGTYDRGKLQGQSLAPAGKKWWD